MVAPEACTTNRTPSAPPTEAEERATLCISTQNMWAQLLSVYDAATSAGDASALVHWQLTPTLDRSYHEADEIESMAARLDSLLASASRELNEEDLDFDED